MKKIKVKSGAKGQDQVVKDLVKKPPKGQLVKLKPKKARSFSLPPVGEYWRRSKQFLQEAWIELKKVTWPGRKETMGATAVVLVLVMLISLFLGIVDFGLSRLVKGIIG
ncbi:MAG: preprotein translocase subunit SecE [Deltaproteobacteria bacterium]|nr:preprotein translocase subunit SecE [Deltaproteobacteria bacterium]